MRKVFYILIPFLILMLACEHEPVYTPIEGEDPGNGNGENGNGNGNGDGGDNGEACDPETVYFENDVLPIIASNCAISGCHGNGSAQDDVELSDFSGIMEIIKAGDAFDSEIYEVITEDDPDDIMPPPPNNPLTEEQIATIVNWINQGANNNECTNSACDLSNVTYSQSVWPIIQNNCTGCHSGGSPQGGISLTNYTEISVFAGNGFLSGVINHENGFVPMPFNGDQLDQCSIDTIDEWINQGFPDN